MKINSRLILFIGVLFCSTFIGLGREVRRVLVVHSYEDSYAGYPKFNQLLADAFAERGIEVDLRFFYLNCEMYREQKELERMSAMLDTMMLWKPEIILVNEDQATYSLLKCGHPLLKILPVVFSGVSYPNWELMEQYPNVTGFHDKIDIKKNIEMARELFGQQIGFFTVLDSTYLDKKIREDAGEQLKDEKICNLGRPDATDEENMAMLSEGYVPFNAVSVRNANPGKAALIWNLSKFSMKKCYIQLKRDFTTIGISNFSNRFGLTAINDGFDCGEKLLGGYMTPLETQVEEEVDVAARILNGASISMIPICESHKEYVVDWRIMEQIGIGKNDIPDFYKIINIPFREQYYILWVVIVISITILLAALISWLLFLYRREQKRKKKAQIDLADKKESLELAIEGSDTFAWKLEKDCFIFETAFWEAMKQPEKDLDIESLIVLSHPDDKEQIRLDWESHLSARKKIVQLRCDFNGKGYQWWEFRYTTTQLSTGGYQTAGLLLNIQEVKEKEFELEEARRIAEKAELKESFLANMSHEIRTPLNAIVGFTNIVTTCNDLPEEEKQEYMNIINKNTELLLKLINDILELSRLDAGQMSFDFSVCSVDKLINDIYITHQMLVPSHLTFLKEVPASSSLEVRVDIGRVTQVLTNFLNNACKFTSEGYIKLGYIYVEDRNEVHIYVEDSGKGIPEEAQKIIFSRFYKHDEFTQGTGLGLSICKVIIKKLGGQIKLQSEEGKGSRFTIVLPCV